MRKTAAELSRLAETALVAAGAHSGMAQAAARHLVRAEEQGLATHGMSRVPFYVAMLKNGRADGNARPRIVNQRPGACLIDNADGLPYESCELAIAQVVERARANGVGLASITNSSHMGVLGIHLGGVTAAGMAGMAFTNSPAAIPAWGGRKALFGTNPIAAAFPRPRGDPLVIDLALTTVVRGRIMLAAQKGEPIPEGWALDRDGKPTTDAKEAMERGSLFPIGGSKGAMLALAFELLCSALAGAHFGREADSFFAERGNKPRVGQLFMAIDPGALAGSDTYAARVEALVAAMLEDPEVRLPGSRRFAAERRSRADGIEVADDLLARVAALAGL